MELPRGVGVVRVQLPGGPMWLVSDRLTRDEEWTGRVMASERARLTRWPAVILRETEIAICENEIGLPRFAVEREPDHLSEHRLRVLIEPRVRF